MSQQVGFSDALKAAEQLDPEAQAELVVVLSRRLAERGRERLAGVVVQIRREFGDGQCRPVTAAELVCGARYESYAASLASVRATCGIVSTCDLCN